MSVLALVLAADPVARAIRVRRDAIAEATGGVREAERYLAWAYEYGTPEQLAEAQQIADAWAIYRDSL